MFRRNSEDRGPNVGWLFADLLLALTVIFLVANATGTIALPPKPPQKTPTPVLLITPTPTAVPLSIDPHDLDLQFTITNYTGLTNGTAAAQQSFIASFEQQLKAHNASNRHVGITLIYSGTSAALADSVSALLPASVPTFAKSVFREYFSVGKANSYLEVDIFFFH